MKKTKILVPLLSCASVTAAVVPLATSCGPSMYTLEYIVGHDPQDDITALNPGTYTEETATKAMFDGMAKDQTLIAKEIISDLHNFEPATDYHLLTAKASTVSNADKKILSFVANSTFNNGGPHTNDIYYNTEARNIEYQAIEYGSSNIGANIFAPKILVEVTKAYDAIVAESTDAKELTLKALKHAQDLAKDDNWFFTYKTNNSQWGGTYKFSISASNIYEYALFALLTPGAITVLSLIDYAIEPKYIEQITIE